jgi:RNA polymerase-binding transcription factor DksA
MATKKTIQEQKPALKTPQASKEVAATKAGSLKMKPVVPLKEKKPAVLEKAGLNKLSAVKPFEKDAEAPSAKNIKSPVKKTPLSVINGSKEVEAPKKEATLEKKTKITLAPEKEIKPVKPSAKAVKSAEGNKLVVIPKTSTDKKVDYEPDFLKSVLDTPAIAPAGPTMRYSDAELQEFRDLISKKLDAAKKELAYLQGLITRRDEMGGDETDNRYMTMEDGGMSMEREQLSQMASRQITFIDHLEKALMRIENKTYGICRVTGKLIDKARLRAVPHATLSMEAKMGIAK